MSTGLGATDWNSAWDGNPLLPFFLLICGAIYEEHTGPPVFPLHCFHLQRGYSLKNPNPDKAGRFFHGYHPPQPTLKSLLLVQLSSITQIQKNSRGSSNQFPQGSIFSAQRSSLFFGKLRTKPCSKKNWDNPCSAPTGVNFSHFERF